jgi:hypothetical protein
MFLPLPKLDDRRWAELVEDGRALIPLYAPEWTDHNISDPGITFTELFAWIAEMQGFELDRIPGRHRRKFLSLIGVAPTPPAAARTVLQFGLPPGAQPVHIPDTFECEGHDASDSTTRVRTLRPLDVLPLRLERITSSLFTGNRDLTGRWRRSEAFAPFGEDPRPGAALVLELSSNPPANIPLSIFVSCAGDRRNHAERARIEHAEALRRSRCRTPCSLVACDPSTDDEPEKRPLLLHHSVRTVWEVRVGPGSWLRLDAGAAEVVDETCALTLDGRVQTVVSDKLSRRLAAAGDRFVVRCRFVEGAYDASPLLLDLAVNGVEAEQAVPAAGVWIFARGAEVALPKPGDEIRLGLELDENGEVSKLDASDESAPSVLVLAAHEQTPSAGATLELEAELLGRSDGSPEQAVLLREPPVQAASFRLWTLVPAGAGTASRRWRLRPDLDASGPADPHAVLDAQLGTITFGDGEHGLVPPAGAAIVAVYRTTRAHDGNLGARAVDAIVESPHNGTLPPDAVTVTNPVPLTGGAAGETLENAEGRAVELVEARTRAITAADFERLALETPGVRLARVSARPNLHPGFPCVEAVGVVTVIVVPYLPADRPAPSHGVRRVIAAYLAAHRLVGTRVEVTGPEYTTISVRASISPTRVASRRELAARVARALDAFLHPLHGGPDGNGWPFGRDVVRSEILQVIDGVPGVDHVLNLELVDLHGVSCGNVCVGPLGLVAAGRHEITVVAA